MTWKPPGLRKPSKDHFLIFHRYSTELFRGWTCLLDFCKLLANMGLWKIVNVSAFGKPDASKIMNVLGFWKKKIDVPHDIPHIYVAPWSYFLIFLKTAYAIWMFHTIFLIYICAFVKINEFDVPHDVPHIYMCFSFIFVLHVPHDVPHIYIYSKNKHSRNSDVPQGSCPRGAWPHDDLATFGHISKQNGGSL